MKKQYIQIKSEGAPNEIRPSISDKIENSLGGEI